MKDPNKLCLGCMNEWEDPGRPCPVCGFVRAGYEKPPRWLPLKHVLNKKYMVGKVIGEGGFGITYLGWDLNLQVRVAIKEYFPMGLATRETGTGGSNQISALPGVRQENYRQGLEKFMVESQNLSKFYHLQGIVAVKDFFFENATAYMVMEYIDGITLGTYLKERGGQLTEQEVLQLFHPVMESLKVVHQAGIVHRDISPDNIMMTRDSQMKLIDFGAARFAGGDTERSLTIILKHGYAPAEQYQSHGNQGPWTDVYAVCATMYRMITGKVPPSAMDRLHEDTLERFQFMGLHVSERTAYAVIDRGMAIKVENRCQNMEELIEGLYGTGKFRHFDGKKMLPFLISAVAVGAVCAGVGLWWILGRGDERKPDSINAEESQIAMNPLSSEETDVSDDGWQEQADDTFESNRHTQVSPEELSRMQQTAMEAAGKLSAGDFHLLSVREDGTVAASGMNCFGNLNVSKWNGIVSVSAGKTHTVGIREDKTAIAAGDTSEGKCAVDTWKELVKASAGEGHTIGLKEDGTVVAAGNNLRGQCNVSDWIGMVDVSAGAVHSLGLKEDGRVIAVGEDSEGQCQVDDWTDIIQIAAGTKLSAGLRADGTIVLAGDTRGLEDALAWQQVIAISLGEDYIAGLLSDRKVVVAGSDIVTCQKVEAWENIEAIAAADGTLFGKKTDGSIVRTTFSVGSVERESLTELQKIVSGGGYLAGLKKDGTVVTWGVSGKDFGQADVSNWSGIQDVAACADGIFGVKTDGMLEVIGEGYGEVAAWTGIEQIAAADGLVLGLKEDGSLAVFGQKAGELDLGSWRNLRQIAVGGGSGGSASAGGAGVPLVAGIQEDGKAVMTFQGRQEGGDACRQVACGREHVVMVKEDGTVSVSARNSGGYSNVYSWRDVIQAAAGAEHTIGLKSDGTVLAAGSNANGQCEVSGWTDVVSVAAGDYYTMGLQSDGTLLIAGKMPGEF